MDEDMISSTASNMDPGTHHGANPQPPPAVPPKVGRDTRSNVDKKGKDDLPLVSPFHMSFFPDSRHNLHLQSQHPTPSPSPLPSTPSQNEPSTRPRPAQTLQTPPSQQESPTWDTAHTPCSCPPTSMSNAPRHSTPLQDGMSASGAGIGAPMTPVVQTLALGGCIPGDVSSSSQSWVGRLVRVGAGGRPFAAGRRP